MLLPCMTSKDFENCLCV